MWRYYDLTVTLDHVHPPPWRRFLIAVDTSLADLHRAIQDACGWENYHLFEFSSPSGEGLAGVPDQDWDERPVRDASAVPVSAVLDGGRASLSYVYDFGDHWEHTIRCEGVVESEERFHRRLVAGHLAFPPEDCGGVPGYERCVDVARGDDDEEGLRDWLGAWDPERFDLAAARRAFDTAARPPASASRFLRPGLPPPSEVVVVEAPTQSRPALAAAAEHVEPLARLRRFTQWAGGGRKLTGTGNLTRAAGAELIGLLGTEDRLDEQIGDRVFKTKSTVELRGVDFTYRLARQAGFVKVRKGTVSATKRGTQLGRDALADWQAAFKGLLNLGVLQHHYANATWIDPYWKELVDGQVPGLLARLLSAADAVPLVELQERLWELVEATFVLDDLDAEQLRRHREHLDHDVRHVCNAFADLGAVVVTDVETVTTVYGHEQEHGGMVALTPLGAAAVLELTGQ
ncbi:MAG: hypothetical protein GEU74_15725 [Nitriliruptorales bacterium]|nr:hypothetical protein [Nitriliruptorales bacterium]